MTHNEIRAYLLKAMKSLYENRLHFARSSEDKKLHEEEYREVFLWLRKEQVLSPGKVLKTNKLTKEYLESLAEDINPEKVFLLDLYQRGRLHMVLDLIRLLEVNEENHEQAIEY